jgi:hypothetical protein
MSWEDFERAIEEEKRAERKSIAELHKAICTGNPHVQDENGRWLTSEEVYNKLLKGDTK